MSPPVLDSGRLFNLSEKFVRTHGGSIPVGSDDHAVLTNLGVTVFFGQIEAQIPGAISVGGLILPGSSRADDGKLEHGLVCGVDSVILVGQRGDRGSPLQDSDDRRPHFVRECIGELRCYGSSSNTVIGREKIKLRIVIVASDPHRSAVREAGCL